MLSTVHRSVWYQYLPLLVSCAVVALLTAHVHHAIVAAAVSLLTTSTHPLTAVLFPRVHRIYLDMHTRTVHTARATLLLMQPTLLLMHVTCHHEYTYS